MSDEGHVDADVPIHEWGKLPFDILENVGRLLSASNQAAARLTCTAWRTGISFGVMRLRPRTVPNAGSHHATHRVKTRELII